MNIAFLIEGALSDSNRFREIVAAKSLAEANGAKLFDAIESYSAKHSATLLKELSKEQWPLFALVCITDFAEEGSIEGITKNIIRPAFDQLISDGEITELPDWLTLINQTDIGTFIQTQLDEHFLGEISSFKIFSKELHEKMIRVSNNLSSDNLLSFLMENPDVEYVYALLGKNHLDFLDQMNGIELIALGENMRKLQIILNEKLIVIEIHAGTHGKMDHFDSMQRSCREAGLLIPDVPQEPSVDVRDLLNILGLFSPNSSAREPRTQRLDFFEPDTTDVKNITAVHQPSNITFNLEQAASSFDHWMKAYNHYGDLSSGESLLEWLYCDNGSELVPDYESFCLLAEKLNTMEYHIPEPPEESRFEQAIRESLEHRNQC